MSRRRRESWLRRVVDGESVADAVDRGKFAGGDCVAVGADYRYRDHGVMSAWCGLRATIGCVPVSSGSAGKSW